MTHTIKVQMFGNFRMDYNGAPFVADKMHKESQFNRLMQAMMHYSTSGIAKDKLEEIVIGERDIDAPHTALRVIVYKTKQKLSQLGLPGKDLIYLEGGIYYWTPDIEIDEDAARFERYFRETEELDKQLSEIHQSINNADGNDTDGGAAADKASEIENRKLELYMKAFYLYKGEFLAPYTGETWIAQEARRYDEASKYYSEVVDYYLKECGIYPSASLMEILERYSNQMNHTYEILENIQEGMNEHNEEGNKGGYFCSYPIFRGIYQASARIMKRTTVSVYLMLCTLVDKDGKQIQSEMEMNKYSRQLKECIGVSIRKSDIYAKYGKLQFLILLVGTNRENCEIVQKRINRQFKSRHPRASVKYHVNSVICEL